jgi:aspartate aminotransferase-like enzyme
MNSDYASRPVDASTYASIERRFAKLLTTPDLFLLQGEAIVALEAVARGFGRPGSHALNIVTGPYGLVFGNWLERQGSKVENLTVPFNRAVSIVEVREALARESFDVVSVVHAEAATGVVNRLEEIAAEVHRAGALIVVDAVASVGAESLGIDDWGLDATVVSAQKALGGPAGVTGVAISDAGWNAIAANSSAPRDSFLSLLDWRDQWLTGDRSVLPLIANHLETRALDTTIDAVEQEGLSNVIARHVAARDACRRGLRALGVAPWVQSDAEAAAVATTLAPPGNIAAQSLLDASRENAHGSLTSLVTLAPGPLSSEALRISHTGPRASITDVLSTIAALGLGLQSLGVKCDVGSALAAVLER